MAAQAAADAVAGQTSSGADGSTPTPGETTTAPPTPEAAVLTETGQQPPTATSAAKPPKKELGTQGLQNIQDPSHWSKLEKYDADAYLEGAYKKHLSRHANK